MLMATAMFRRAMRPLGGVVASVVALVALLGPTVGRAQPCWRPPVEGAVADPFREPSCRWCPGNRGIEYRIGTDVEVRAAASGTVSFAGDVAGVYYLVIELPTGWRHTYGTLSSGLQDGDRVIAGTIIGRASGEFFFGLRVGDDYQDPAEYLGVWSGRARLVPVDGSSRRASGVPILRCVR